MYNIEGVYRTKPRILFMRRMKYTKRILGHLGKAMPDILKEGVTVCVQGDDWCGRYIIY